MKTPRIKIDEQRREVFVSGKLVHLRPKEFTILALLVREPKKAHTRQEIGRALGYDDSYTELNCRTIDQHIAGARRVIGYEVIETVSCHGYRLA